MSAERGLFDELRLPPGPVPQIPPPEALVDARRADAATWEMAGRRARVVMDGLGGVRRFEGDARTLLERVEVVGTTGANVLLGPRCSRRELVLAGGSLSESVLIPEALPGVVLQWSSGASAGPREVPLRMTLPPGLGEAPVHEAPGLFWIGTGERGLLLHAPGLDGRPELLAEPEGHVLRWDLPLRDGPVTLLAMAAPGGGTWTSLPVLAGAVAHHRRGEIAALGERHPGLVLETGVREMDDGMAWSRSWLRDRLRAVPTAAPGLHPTGALAAVGEALAPEAGSAVDVPAWIARAAAASGDWATSRAALAELDWESPWTRLHGALATARYVAWTGDGRPLEAAAARIRRAFADRGALAGIPDPVTIAVHEAVTAAAEAGEVGALAGLPRPTPAPRPGRGLPVLGATPTPPPGEGADHPWLGPLGFRPVPGAAADARTALAAVAADPARLGEGWGVRAVLRVMEGMLGARPDATFARLGLSPVFPPSWTRFTARGIRTGEGMLQLDYEREEDRARWTLLPREGSVPLTAVFTPWLPWAEIGRIRVDDEPAELDVETRGEWSRLRIQLPVDGPHTVEVEGVGPRADTDAR